MEVETSLKSEERGRQYMGTNHLRSLAFQRRKLGPETQGLLLAKYGPIDKDPKESEYPFGCSGVSY